MPFHGSVAYLDYGGLANDDAENDRIARALIDGARVVLMKSPPYSLCVATTRD
jgi:hypothetical protein